MLPAPEQSNDVLHTARCNQRDQCNLLDFNDSPCGLLNLAAVPGIAQTFQSPRSLSSAVSSLQESLLPYVQNQKA